MDGSLGGTRAAGPDRAEASSATEIAIAEDDTSASTVSVSYRVLIEQGQDVEDARREAIQGAQSEAIRRVVGAQVRARQELRTVESHQELREHFSEAIQVDAAGRVVRSRILDETVERGPRAERYYRVAARITVRPEVGESDPSFRITRFELNDRLFFDRGPPRESDEVIATVQTSEPAYLTIIQVSGDTLQVLLPNRLMDRRRVPAGEPYEFPPERWRDRGLRLRAQLPSGTRESREELVVIATKEAVPLFARQEGEVIRQGAVNTVEARRRALNRWLVSIPLDERAVAWSSYQIRAE